MGTNNEEDRSSYMRSYRHSTLNINKPIYNTKVINSGDTIIDNPMKEELQFTRNSKHFIKSNCVINSINQIVTSVGNANIINDNT